MIVHKQYQNTIANIYNESSCFSHELFALITVESSVQVKAV